MEGGCYLASPRTFRRRRVQVEAETPAFACAPAAWKGGSEGGALHQYHGIKGFCMQRQANLMPQTTPDGRQTCRGAVHGLRVTWGWLQHMPACPRPPWYRCRQPWQPFLPNCQPLPWASMAAKKNRAHTFGCAGAVRSSHAASRALAALSSLPRRGRVLYIGRMVVIFISIELVQPP